VPEILRLPVSRHCAVHFPLGQPSLPRHLLDGFHLRHSGAHQFADGLPQRGVVGSRCGRFADQQGCLLYTSGFTSTVGIIHDGDGQLQPLADTEREVYSTMRAMEKSSYARINGFQDNIAHGKENQWRCRAGSRYLYICENGLVHYLSLIHI